MKVEQSFSIEVNIENDEQAAVVAALIDYSFTACQPSKADMERYQNHLRQERARRELAHKS